MSQDKSDDSQEDIPLSDRNPLRLVWHILRETRPGPNQAGDAPTADEAWEALKLRLGWGGWKA